MSGSAESKAPTETRAAADGALAKSYIPADHEQRIWDRWESAKAFHAEAVDSGPPYCVLIPPPNVTAALHLGHALNNTLQDVLVRCHRMRGCNTLWMPGTDHAGIATQAVVEKRLQQQGKRRTDFTRAQFILKVQEWKDEYAATILSQLKLMGCSCDFDRTRFTMDPVCTEAVREAFFRLFADGLIYRGKRLVNWDPATQTALADDEVDMEEVDGHMWYLRYPLEDGSGHVTVATTRPETMLGDTAVAVNPKDPRAAALKGKRVRLPLADRLIPIVEDDYVVMPVNLGGDPADAKSAIASGFLKVTPAHDTNDWEIGIRHSLAVINVLAPDGTISDRHGWDDVSEQARPLVGLTREAARKAVVEWFRSAGLLEEIKAYRHSVGHSYRSHVPIEPYLSDQWYVRVTDARMRDSALSAMATDQRQGGGGGDRQGDVRAGDDSAAGRERNGDAGLRFFPARYARTFQQWHEGIRDWCISRQLWWGHQIPVWHRTVDAGKGDSSSLVGQPASDPLIAFRLVRVADATELSFFGGASPVSTASVEGECLLYACTTSDASGATLERAGFNRDPDVLDTWFSSALWPLSTLGWPHPERHGMVGLLDRFNPSAVLSTAREIITLWVSRMVMFNRYFRGGTLPFGEVFIHCVVQDGFGQKMSKSLGNGVDPRDIIATHGADAMRFVMAQISTDTQDVRLPVDLLCPHTGATFAPRTIKTSSGHEVAAPIQTSPTKPDLKMVTVYGVTSGEGVPTPGCPLARNTSSRFDIGRNFANKLWNASRFALAQCSAPRDPALATQRPVRLLDRWMVSRLARAVGQVDTAMASYRFSDYSQVSYELVWRDFCDWYLEASKGSIRSDPMQQQVLRTVLDASLRLLHPLMPFVTESIWEAMASSGAAGVGGLDLPACELLARAKWPAPTAMCVDQESEEAFARVQGVVEVVRNLRGERRVEPRRRIVLHVSQALSQVISSGEGVVESLAGIGEVRSAAAGLPADAVAFSTPWGEGWLSALVDAVDSGAERDRLARMISERERAATGYRAKLGNPGYMGKARPEVIEETRGLLQKVESEIAAAQRALQSLVPSLLSMLVPFGLGSVVVALTACAPKATVVTADLPGAVAVSNEAGGWDSSYASGDNATASAAPAGARVAPWNMGAIRGEVLETDSYRIRSTLRDPYIRDLLPQFMEQALVHYRTDLADLPHPDRLMETWVFGSREEWTGYTQQRLKSDAGPYLALPRGGYTTQGEAVLYDLGATDTLAIATHEGWHQYSQSVFRAPLPAWLEEGIACFMEGHRLRNAQEPVVFIPWRNLERFGELRSAARRDELFPLSRIVGEQPHQFLVESKDGLLTYYAQVWALVHYLNEGEGGKYRGGLHRILADAVRGTLSSRLKSESLRLGVSTDRALITAYLSSDFDDFAGGYESFVRRMTVRGAGDAIWHGRSPLAPPAQP